LQPTKGPHHAVCEPSPAVVHARVNSLRPRIVPVAALTVLCILAAMLAQPARAQPVQPAPGAAAPALPAPQAKPRPKVGLVLSGGGARGLTHIGVLKVLHDLKVPVDYIAATSMGAIVGGLYASGMTPEAMQRALGAVSWPTLLADSPPRQDVNFRRKEELSQFPLAFEIGYRDGEFLWFKGALSGANLELFLHELTRNVDNVENFDLLPIPYRAVATNMVTGKEVIFDRGRLFQAMRASMSVPGMFAPMELGGRILGDGGLVNNLPVDIVRAMGADIVIAVNIGTPLMSRDQLQSVVGYASQMLNILTEQNVRAQLATLGPKDILISPDLGDLTFIDFAAAPKFVDLGIKAAEAVLPQLTALADSQTQYAEFEKRFVVTPQRLPEKLDFVSVEGTHYANPEVLEDQMETQPDKPFSMKTLEGDLAKLYGRGDFEQIDYQLVSVGQRQGLVVNVTEKSWGPNFLRFGVSLSTDFQGETYFNLMFGHKRVWLNSLGAEWTNEVILGSTRRYATELYQPLSLNNRVFVSGYGLVQRAPEFIFDGSTRLAEYDVLTETAGVDIGTPFSTNGEARLGFKWIHYRGNPTIADEHFPNLKTTETGARLLVRWDTLDNPYFPRHGTRVNAEAFYGSRTTTLLGLTLTNDNSSRTGVVADVAFPVTRDSFLNFQVRAGGITTSARGQDNIIEDYNLGGFLQLSGLRTNQLSGNYMGFARGVYYYQIANLPIVGRAIYAGVSFEAGNVWEQSSNISSKGLLTAGSAFIAADTWLGPFYIAYGAATGGQRSFYLYLGRL
jgi:NTE family protein